MLRNPVNIRDVRARDQIKKIDDMFDAVGLRKAARQADVGDSVIATQAYRYGITFM